MIHATIETVELLRKGGKSAWVRPRAEKIHVKGKGLLQTFWVDPIDYGSCAKPHAPGFVEDPSRDRITAQKERIQRLVTWNAQQLYGMLENLVAARKAVKKQIRTKARRGHSSHQENSSDSLGRKSWDEDRTPLTEMTQIIDIPEFDPNMYRNDEPVEIHPKVKQQLLEFVVAIAERYRDVPFHNFEHASHVVMSSFKLMKRIMRPSEIDCQAIANGEAEPEIAIAREVHRMTYGLSSDLLTQFAVVFSGLIHDVDHTGLSNKELSDMDAPVAVAYDKKCVAEQNSVEIAWSILMEEQFRELRSCIFESSEEKARFRELVVDAVLATDIADKELATLRKSRWDDAFSTSPDSDVGTCLVNLNRKATIVFEHIIQASDVSHCMQHWHTYQRFNARLFEERYIAYRKGVAGDKPPWEGWYNGELWFFDNYIVPLAQKLNDCGVFGVSYHELLNYAQANRVEWERKGVEIVEGLRAEVTAKYAGEKFKGAADQL
jgi:3'5'-cyclic nucleotide phosphodiesterase